MKRGKVMSVNEKDIILSLLKINECLCLLLSNAHESALHNYKDSLIKEIENFSILYKKSFERSYFEESHAEIIFFLENNPFYLLKKLTYNIIIIFESNDISLVNFTYLEILYFYLKEIENE